MDKPTPLFAVAELTRREVQRKGMALLAVAVLWGAARQAGAVSLADLSNGDASNGVKAALEKGALAAVGLLGRNDGFWGNPQVRIPLPSHLEDAARLLRTLGQGKRIDELELAMNRAAEAAVPQGKEVLLAAVRGMSVTDAKSILTGGETSVTDFFAQKTRQPLSERFLPIVTRATEHVGLAQKYNAFAGRAAQLGLLKPDDASLQGYVTGKTLDGLFVVIAEQERQLRQDPVGAGSALLQKVFGALK